jgi:biopolymer transport protein ExbB
MEAKTQMTRNLKILLILGAVLALAAPVIGLFFTIISMILTFRDLGKSGIADPHGVARDIGFTLEATAAGLIFSAIGVFLVVIALLKLIFKKPPLNLN